MAIILPTCPQRITEQSAELESEAANFATLAQQIRKNTETWWWKR
jgi:syntaxin-binding protein 5